ncbi:MAG: hypothetical protein JNL79_23925 [Myxococcales bacterium]|nr:hypothetical protein [Myxococcales bacterium]
MRLLLALALLAGCNSSPAKTGTEDPCHPTPPTRCEVDKECAPYHCRSNFCDKGCESSSSCSPGFVCKEHACVKAGACGSCSGDYDCPAGQKCELGAGVCH